MNGSYVQHAADTKEFAEGRNAIGSRTNPYTYGSETSKQWLDWQLGFNSVSQEMAEVAHTAYLEGLAIEGAYMESLML